MSTTSKTCPCPHCDGMGIWLSAVSESAYVDYYRCFTCSNVWTVPKDKCEPIHGVTVNLKVEV